MKRKGNEMMIYALNQNEQLVHVDSVSNGLRCNCHCPACMERLTAKQGKKNLHHFAHYSENEHKCAYGYQTSLHLLAKEIFMEGCKLLLPPVDYDKELLDYSKFDDKAHAEVQKHLSKAFSLLADSVELEKQYDDFIPDIILQYKGRPLIAEIYVTHQIDEEKARKIRTAGVSAIEFDLSKIDREIDKACLREIFESGENCHWVYNVKGSEKTKEFMQIVEQRYTERQLERKRQKEEQEKKKALLISQYGGDYHYYKTFSPKYLDGSSIAFVIDPPCKEKTFPYNGNLCTYADSCRNCPYFIQYEYNSDLKGWNPGSTPVRVLCQRRKNHQPNKKTSSFSTEKEIMEWIKDYYVTNSKKVSKNAIENGSIVSDLFVHAKAVSRLYGHGESLDWFILSFCEAFVKKKQSIIRAFSPNVPSKRF